MYKYTKPSLYRQQQIFKICYCKTHKQAAEIFDCSINHIQKYVTRVEVSDACPFTRISAHQKDVFGYFDSGLLFTTKRDLIRKEMPIQELYNLVDEAINSKYS